MQYAVIMAGGAGSRLWPMSRSQQPKQLIPFLEGRCLLEVAYDRFAGMLPAVQRYICAAERHRDVISSAISTLADEQFIGEPTGRDTLAAVGLSAAVLAATDPDATMGIFTSDHLIEPVDEFQKIIAAGFELVEQQPNTLVTFGITPTRAATGFGYLELGESISNSASIVSQFHEKPEQPTADDYFSQGPERFLWNSGMFVWRAETLLDCIQRYEPEVHASLQEIASAWGTPAQMETLNRIFPTVKKISIDYAVMEPASRDEKTQVAAIPMPLKWLDIGSWPAFAETLPHDDRGNAISAEKHVLHETKNCLVASNDPNHLITTIGCEDLIVIHTDNATLICRSEQAEQIKAMQQAVDQQFAGDYT